MWFAKSLTGKGHTVLAAIRRPQAAYAGLRAHRLEQLAGDCDFVWNIPFGSPAFLDLIARQGPFDVLCHHAAEVVDYKSADFDAIAATTSNTLALRDVLARLRQAECRRIVLTGSVFEADEGTGSDPGRAVSPYGLSKTLTSQIFKYHAEQEGFALGKFVIPNPFGPYEGRRFTDYLMRCWKDGKTASVATPRYVRDNIPVTLLAAAYVGFVEKLPKSGFHKFNPSFYSETQGTFARRFASAMGERLNLATPLECAEQREFPEPEIRVNTDALRGAHLGWSEQAFWDETARYYAQLLGLAVK
jgi:nucleoside-diphosphate-sugar epimerase